MRLEQSFSRKKLVKKKNHMQKIKEDDYDDIPDYGLDKDTFKII